jgi:lysozyme
MAAQRQFKIARQPQMRPPLPPRGGKGISVVEAEYNLSNDIDECWDDLRALFVMWDCFTPARQAALVNLRYQLGPARFRAFRKMIAAVDNGDWQIAAKELADSALDRQTPARNRRRVRDLELG